MSQLLAAPSLGHPGVAGLLLAVLGSVIGSFCSVILTRVPAGASVVTPRSHCPSCRHLLGPLDLIPLLSYLWLKGRCRYCRSPVSSRYVLLELVCGFIPAAVGFGVGWAGGFTLLAVFPAAALVYARFTRTQNRDVRSKEGPA